MAEKVIEIRYGMTMKNHNDKHRSVLQVLLCVVKPGRKVEIWCIYHVQTLGWVEPKEVGWSDV